MQTIILEGEYEISHIYTAYMQKKKPFLISKSKENNLKKKNQIKWRHTLLGEKEQLQAVFNPIAKIDQHLPSY